MTKKMPGWMIVIMFLAIGLDIAGAAAGSQPAAQLDSGQLFAFIQKEDRRIPLVEFGKAEDRVDEDLSRENRAFLHQNQTLLTRIRNQLESDSLNWELLEASQRLMIVPENRPAYAALFENYCQSAIDYVLQKTHLPNPYRAIATFPETSSPVPLPSGQDGITAFLVHNIADVYTEEYIFSDADGRGQKIKIKLSNRSYTGEVGSYSSYLIIGEDQKYDFIRNPYTLWRNSADDPLNVLIAPIEETLHIALRRSTENAIKRRLDTQPPETLPAIEQIIEEWLAVEEAAVGGMVRQLMPEIMDRFLSAGPWEDIDATLHARHAFDKYRYLNQGIRIVEDLGLDAAIELYQKDPQTFKTLLGGPSINDVTSENKVADDQAIEKPA
ncbi:MAG: hypothetical protein JJV98_17035 [Desulfosarcina sp.]|nr:hypothetical protein [Desulfobacterales bacterium]